MVEAEVEDRGECGGGLLYDVRLVCDSAEEEPFCCCCCCWASAGGRKTTASWIMWPYLRRQAHGFGKPDVALTRIGRGINWRNRQRYVYHHGKQWSVSSQLQSARGQAGR